MVEDHEYRIPYTALYVSCGACGSAHQVPMPSPEILSSFYPENYHSQVGKGTLGRIRNALRLGRLKRWLQKGDVVLDYGCGDGTFLLQAADTMPGYRFFGYEISSKTSIRKNKNGSVVIVEGGLEDLLKTLPPSRLVTMNHVIEHLPDPQLTLLRLYSKLVPGGILEGQTPAAGCLEQKIFKSSWSGYHAPRHTVIFSPKGLRELLKSCGFKKVKVTPAFNPASWAVSLASAAEVPGGGSGIRRKGMIWLFWLGLATLLAPIDFFSGAPAIMNFSAVKE